jgi:hypothetical protein
MLLDEALLDRFLKLNAHYDPVGFAFPDAQSMHALRMLVRGAAARCVPTGQIKAQSNSRRDYEVDRKEVQGAGDQQAVSRAHKNLPKQSRAAAQ